MRLTNIRSILKLATYPVKFRDRQKRYGQLCDTLDTKKSLNIDNDSHNFDETMRSVPTSQTIQPLIVLGLLLLNKNANLYVATLDSANCLRIEGCCKT